MTDIREHVARYYDAATRFSDDIAFYPNHVPPQDRTVLELGCGTGRVLLPLSNHCDSIVGVEKSPAMLEVCILNVFNPNAPPDKLISTWDDDVEVPSFELPYHHGILKQSYRKKDIQTSPLVLFPEIIYRYYENDELVEEASFVTTMRVWYPEEFISLIENHGYDIVEKWGGYAGETYGEGRELVVKVSVPGTLHVTPSLLTTWRPCHHWLVVS